MSRNFVTTNEVIIVRSPTLKYLFPPDYIIPAECFINN